MIIITITQSASRPGEELITSTEHPQRSSKGSDWRGWCEVAPIGRPEDVDAVCRLMDDAPWKVLSPNERAATVNQSCKRDSRPAVVPTVHRRGPPSSGE